MFVLEDVVMKVEWQNLLLFCLGLDAYTYLMYKRLIGAAAAISKFVSFKMGQLLYDEVKVATELWCFY